jgi:hypothetical protein
MSILKYENRGFVTAISHFDLEVLKGKSVVITGGKLITDTEGSDQWYPGANGLGKGYAKAFVDAGYVFLWQRLGDIITHFQSAYMTIGDVNRTLGEQTVAELGSWVSTFSILVD